MEKKRIELVDYLRGLALISVVWFHTAHPAFLNFSWFIPLLFFISGFCFHPYEPKTFLKKKINQLLVPMVFFYLIYCLYYFALYVVKYQELSNFNFHVFFNVFDLYSGVESFTINPPLWFIFALLDIQFVMYGLIRLTRNKYIVLAISLLISIIGSLWLYELPTLFMVSRSSPYFIYFAAGFCFGKPLLDIVTQEKSYKYWALLVSSLFLFLISIIAINVFGYESYHQFGALDYTAVFSFIILLFFLMHKLCQYKMAGFIAFFGKNTLVLYGFHEMLLTIMLIGVNHIFGENNLLLGIIQVILVLCITYPLTLWCNKYIPKLIGKQDLF